MKSVKRVGCVAYTLVLIPVVSVAFKVQSLLTCRSNIAFPLRTMLSQSFRNESPAWPELRFVKE
jgi:hypothetical protein